MVFYTENYFELLKIFKEFLFLNYGKSNKIFKTKILQIYLNTTTTTTTINKPAAITSIKRPTCTFVRYCFTVRAEAVAL